MKKVLLLMFIPFIFISINIYAKESKTKFVPPPIPIVNSNAFKNYVRQYHTMPSPYGFEPYRNAQGQPLQYLLKDLNPDQSYVPVTFICNSRMSCPVEAVLTFNGIAFRYANGDQRVLFFNKSRSIVKPIIIGVYFPDDPRFYVRHRIKRLDNIHYGDTLATLLISHKALQAMTKSNAGVLVKEKDKLYEIYDPFADGNESLSLGTTLVLLGLGQASGVEFTQSVSQITGTTYTKQAQTVFTTNVSLSADITIGGGIIPITETIKMSVNKTLSTLVGNELAINNQSVITRSYTIKPGINDTYLWGVYQLYYSYRVNAPFLEQVLFKVVKRWNNEIAFKIADNGLTQDNKPIGNILGPQEPYGVNDITVGVAVPIQSNAPIHTEKLN